MISQGMIGPEIDHAEAVNRYRKAIKKGVVKVMSKMGISTIQSYRGAQIFEAIGLNKDFIDRYFDKTASRIGGIGLEEIARETLHHHRRAYADREVGPPLLDWGGQYQWRREGEYHLFNPETVFRLQHATSAGRYEIFKQYTKMVDDQNERLCTLRGLFDFKLERPDARADRGGRAGRVDRHAVRHRRDVLRLDQRRGARDPGHRHEPDRRPEQHRRRGRRPDAEHPRAQRRQPPEQGQAGRLGPVRRHQRIPRQRRRDPDQDGARGQARRRGAAPRPQGLALDRQGPLLHAGRLPDQPAAAPRHLLDRGPRPAHPRPQERQPPAPDQRQAGGRGRRRHRRGGRGQGAQRRGHDLGPRRRHRRQPADVAQARRHPLGARPGRDPADPRPEPAPRPRDRPGRRPDEDRPRRRDRRPAGGRGVRLRHGAAGRDGLHHDAGLPPRHLPGRDRDAEPQAPREVRRPGRARRQLLPVHRRGSPRADGEARLPDPRRHDRPERPARHEAGDQPLQGPRARLQQDLLQARDRPPGRPSARRSTRTTASTRRSTSNCSRWPRRLWRGASRS